MNVELYDPNQKEQWNNFVRQSRNGTFLFFRDYMEYHKERFRDHSLTVWDEKGELAALLPSNIEGKVLVSHAGLSYGGFIVDDSLKMPAMLRIFESTLTYLKRKGLTSFIYKAIPHIYHRIPSEEDRYALFLCNARRISCRALTVLSSRRRLPFQERRLRGAKKAKQRGLTVRRTGDLAPYWEILSERLRQAHNTAPVHSLEEIELLRSRFPDHIKLFACFQETAMTAGVLIYESEMAAHVQYIAANELGRETGALDLIFEELLDKHYRSKPFFDFGASDEKGGRFLNRGLIDQKEGLGARVVAQESYEIQIDKWDPETRLGV